MRSKLILLIGTLCLMGCITSKDIEKLSDDKSILYPIGEAGRWGFANSDGEKVIPLIYESVETFSDNLALVKSNGKYGYIKKDGSWHIKPKYDKGGRFYFDCASVSIGQDKFYINRKGRKKAKSDCYYGLYFEGCKVILPAKSEKYFKEVNGKYEFTYKYYVKNDTLGHSSNIMDTTSMQLDEVIDFSNEYILLKKDGKYGLFFIWSRTIIIDELKYQNHQAQARKEIAKLIDFKYDEVVSERVRDNEVTYAKVKIGDKYGVIDRRGREVLPTKFYSLNILRGSMALVEYEPDKFGYMKFDGTAFFKER